MKEDNIKEINKNKEKSNYKIVELQNKEQTVKIEELENEVKRLKEKIGNIHNRNRRVEGDKAWETSPIRVLLILICTYVFACLYLFVADTTNPFLGAIVPCAGFFLSTLTIRPIKKYYIKKRNEKLDK